ncbi:hypothetical protein HPB49_007742 [Dermacentor silvarum]|uniref:Uncharacterized protein n=1 Tax=Dermacentor silvarum TaxID=543639 RepID=A0ACB8C815_DERSI|nr:hypothetical protein HPB49_007742 [Dermacentor silvarum]
MGLRVSEGQWETMLAFMEQHLQLALRSSELGPGFSLVDQGRLWQQLADVLNAEGPVVKTVDQWRKQQVYEARRDATAIAQEQISTGGGRAPGFRGRVLQLTGTGTDLPYQEVLRRIEQSTTRLTVAAERTAAAQEGILEKLAVSAGLSPSGLITAINVPSTYASMPGMAPRHASAVFASSLAAGVKEKSTNFLRAYAEMTASVTS